MNKLLLICYSIIILFSITTLVSSADLNPFSDTKTFNPTITADMSDFIKADFNEKYGVITLNSKFMYIDTGKIAEYSLVKNTEICSNNCEQIIKTTLYEDGTLYDNIEYVIEGKNTPVITKVFIVNGIEYYSVSVPIYKEVCEYIPANFMYVGNNNTCYNQTIGYEEEIKQRETYYEYNGEVLKAGNYKYKIVGNISLGQRVDVILNKNEKRFTEWAWWDAFYITQNFGLKISSGTPESNTNQGNGYTIFLKINATKVEITKASGDVAQITQISNASGLLGYAFFVGTNLSVNITINLTSGIYYNITANYSGTNEQSRYILTAFNPSLASNSPTTAFNWTASLWDLIIANNVYRTIENISIYYADNNVTAGMTIINSIPLNNSNLTTKPITFGCNITGQGTTNLTSITLNVTNGTILNWNQTITGLNTPNYNATFTNNTILNGTYTWNCIGTGTDANGTSALWTFNQQAYTLPTISFPPLQSPADLNLSNFIGVGGVNITYNISSIVGIPINLSTILLYYKANSTIDNTMFYVNGTAFSGFFPKSYIDNSTNITFRWNLLDNEVLLGTYNYGEVILENTPPIRKLLSQNNNYLSVELLNVSNITRYSFFEIMANSTNTIPVYYCNSSYAFSNAPSGNTNCVLIYTIPANQPYNHQHTNYSSHQVIPFAINVTAGQVGTVKVTSVSNFILRGAGTTAYYVINNGTRSNAFRTSANNGNSWTSNNTITVNAHAHQFPTSPNGNASLYYYACANDTNDNSACSPLSSDIFEVGGLPPNSPQVYSPTNQTYAGIININYTVSFSPNGYDINNYNITLWNSDNTFNQTIQEINYLNLSYAWDSSALSSGSFYIEVRVNDSLNQQSIGQSEIFSLDNTKPLVSLVYPTAINYSIDITELNYTATDNTNLESCWYSLDSGSTNTTITCGNNITGLTSIQGYNTWTIYANDTFGNSNSSSVTFFKDTIFPLVQISFPANTTYNINVTELNYTATDTNLFECWYSLDNGATNTTAVGCNNLTGLTSNEGSNTWSLWANDTVGNTNESTIVFFKDTIFPLIDYGIGTEVNNTNKSINFIYINTTWTETNFYNITFRINGATAIFLTPTYYYNLTGLSGGIYRYNVTICDIVNNCNTTATRTINLDLSNPNVTLIFPPNNTYINNNTLNFTINVSDDVGVKNATIYIYNQTGQVNKTTTNFVVGTIEWLLGIPITLIDGTYNWFADVFDWSGNKQTTINNTLNIKTINPQIKIVYPTNNTNYSNYINQLNYTISGADICKYSLDGGVTNNTITCGDNITIANSEGSFYFIVYATDTYGNFNYTSVNIIVNLTKVVLNSPANASTTFNISTDLSCSGYSNPPANITNISLWDNSTGVFKLNQTQSRTGGQTETIAWTQTGSTADGTPKGFQITAKKNFRLKSVTLETNEGATDCYIRNNSNNQLATASVVGGVGGTATFNYDVINGQVLRVVCGSGSATVTTYDLTPFVQQNGIDFDYTNSLYDTAIANNGYRTIRSITTGTNLYQMNVNFTKNITQSILWTCQVCDINNNCFFANENRTIYPDTTFPVITITAPVGNIAIQIGENLTLSYSITESNPDTCILDYQGVNTTIPCGGTTQTFMANSSKTLIVWANDTFGHLSSATSSWNYSLLINSQTFNPTTTEGNLEIFTLNVTSNTPLTNAFLIYNGTSYSPSITGNGTNYILTATLIVPSVTTTTNYSFFWTLNSGALNTSSQKQLVYNIGVDDCGIGTLKILNLTMYDEETQILIPDGVSGNGTIEVDLTISPINSTIIIINFSKTYNNSNNASVCLSAGALNTSSYFLNAQIRYVATGYTPEFYNIQNYILSNSTALQNINLYPLPTASNTDFLITIKDNSFLSVKNALVMIQRKYIGDGVYKNVEIPLSDNQGQTIGHFNTNSVIYRITIVKDRETLMVFDGITIICTDKVLGQCYLNLNQPSASLGFEDMNTYNNLNYNVSFSQTTRIINLDFNTLDGTSAFMLLNATQFGNNAPVCSNTLLSSAGSLTCTVPLSFGNKTFVVGIYNNNQLIARGIFSIPASPINAESSDAMFFVIILLITIPMLFITDKRFLLIGIVIVFVISMGLGIYMQTSWLGVGSAITWLVIALAIIIWKLSLRNREGTE